MSTHRFFGARAITLFTHGLTVWCTLGRNTLNSGLAGVARWPVSSLTLCFTTWKAYSFGVASFVLTLGTFVDVFALLCLDWCNEHCNFRPMFVSILGWMQGSLTWPPSQTPAALFFLSARVAAAAKKASAATAFSWQTQPSKLNGNQTNVEFTWKESTKKHECHADPVARSSITKGTHESCCWTNWQPSSVQHSSPTLLCNSFLQHFPISTTPFFNTPLHTSLQYICTRLLYNSFFEHFLQHSSSKLFGTILPNTSARDISTRLTFNICATVFSSTSLQRSIPTFLHTQNSLLEHVSTLTTLFSSSPTLLSSFFLWHFSPTLLYNFLQHSSYTSLPHFSATLFSNTSLQHSSTLLFSNASITSQHSSPTLLCNTSLQYSSPTLPWTHNTLLQPFSATLLYTTLLQHLPKLTMLFSKSSLQHFSTLLFSNTLLQHSSSDFFPWNNRLTSMCHVCYMQFFAWLSKQAP